MVMKVKAVAHILVSQILFDNEIFGMKWCHFYNEIMNRYRMELIFVQLITHDKMKLV